MFYISIGFRAARCLPEWFCGYGDELQVIFYPQIHRCALNDTRFAIEG
jgi:hypothetical protein